MTHRDATNAVIEPPAGAPNIQKRPFFNVLDRMSARFIAIDVEVAGKVAGSICQLGFAEFDIGTLLRCKAVLVNPQCRMQPRAMNVHGLEEADVRDAPTWRDVYPSLARQLHGATLVSHTMFDRRQVFAACCRAGCSMFSYTRWLDTCSLARKVWPGLPDYSLVALAQRMHITYRAHDAVEDARAAGELLVSIQREFRRRDLQS